MNFPEINPNHDFSYFNDGCDPPATEFQVSDYLMLDDGFGEDNSSSQSMASSEQVPSGSSSGYSGATSRNNSMQVIMMPTLDYSTATGSLICYFLKKKKNKVYMINFFLFLEDQNDNLVCSLIFNLYIFIENARME